MDNSCTPEWAAGILAPPGRIVFLFALAVLLSVYILVREEEKKKKSTINICSDEGEK